MVLLSHDAGVAPDTVIGSRRLDVLAVVAKRRGLLEREILLYVIFGDLCFHFDFVLDLSSSFLNQFELENGADVSGR